MVTGTLPSMATDDKVRENRMRRTADRQGLMLSRSRRRDPLALDYGVYWLADRDRHLVSPEQGMSLDEVEAFLRPKS